MSDEAALKSCLNHKPNDLTLYAAYADWLQDNDRPVEAEQVRYLAELKRAELVATTPPAGLFDGQLITTLVIAVANLRLQLGLVNV